MKIRTDFVTNSSSSSFVIITKVDKCKELVDYFKEEYGKYGIGLLDNMLDKGSSVCKYYNEWVFQGECIPERVAKEMQENPDAMYFSSSHYTQTDDTDDMCQDDAWLYKHIPDEYKRDIYEEEYT